MKKLFSFFAAGLLLASCSNDDFVPVGVEGTEQEVAISIELPQAPESRYNAGSNVGGTENLNQDLTFNVALYYVGDDANGEGYEVAAWAGTATGAKKATFNPTVVIGKYYRVVATAVYDNDEAGTIVSTNAINDETEDAYFCNVNVKAESHMAVTLTRPFGKLRILTTDMAEALNQFNAASVASIKVTYADGKVPETTYDVREDAISVAQAAASNEAELLAYVEEAGKTTLVTDYILAPATGEKLVSFTVDVVFNNGEKFSREFKMDVPVKRNYVTTLTGAFFTSTADLDVEVDSDFAGTEETINYDIYKLVTEGGVLTLNEDVTIDEITEIANEDGKVVIPAGVKAVLNLNGHTLTYNGTNILFRVNGELTINGQEGAIVAATTEVDAAGFIASANAGAVITINGGTYKAWSTTFQANGGQVFINDGSFEVSTDEQKYTLNHIDGQKNNGLIEVKGGKFYNYNPAESASENPVMNFVAAGYKAVQIGDWYEVVEQGAYDVKTTEELLAAVAEINANTTKKEFEIILTDNVAWATGTEGGGATAMFTNADAIVTIKGNNNTFTATGAGAVKSEAKIIFNDVVIVDETKSYDEGAWEFLYLEFEKGEFEFNNCEFKNPVRFDGKSTKVVDSKFYGVGYPNATSTDEYGVWVYNGTADFVNCYFTGARGIKICDSYSPADATNVVIDGCTFENLTKKPGVAIDNQRGSLDITIKNSTFSGVQAGDQGMYIYETDNVVPTLSNNTVYVTDGVAIIDGVYTLSNAAGMNWFANEVNANGNKFDGKTVVLANDIDLANVVWTPVGQTGATQFLGTFDGQGYTIKNLNIDSSTQTGATYSSGLFGWIERKGSDADYLMAVKNLNVEGATVKGHHNVAVIAGYLIGTIENCHVTGAAIECTHANNEACGDKAGVIAGIAAETNALIKDCSASESTVKAGRDAGQIVGACIVGKVENCTATNVAVSATGDCTGASVENALIGRTK